MFGLVYLITNVLNGKKYVGKTTKPIEYRFQKHVSASRFGSKVHFHNAIKKHGYQNFKIETLIKCQNEDDMNFYETYFIQLYKSYDRTVGYNLTYGGDGMQNPTPETRRRMSASHKGVRNTEQQKQKISLALTGRIISDQHRRKISLAKTGIRLKPLDQDRKRQISIKMKSLNLRCSDKNKEQASKRMKLYNPMFNPETLRKLSLKRRGKIPHNRIYLHPDIFKKILTRYLISSVKMKSIASEAGISVDCLFRLLNEVKVFYLVQDYQRKFLIKNTQFIEKIKALLQDGDLSMAFPSIVRRT